MRRSLAYIAIAGGIALAFVLALASPNIMTAVAQYYVVGGELEAIVIL